MMCGIDEMKIVESERGFVCAELGECPPSLPAEGNFAVMDLGWVVLYEGVVGS